MQQSTFSDWGCSLFAKAIEAPSFRAGSVHIICHDILPKISLLSLPSALLDAYSSPELQQGRLYASVELKRLFSEAVIVLLMSILPT